MADDFDEYEPRSTLDSDCRRRIYFSCSSPRVFEATTIITWGSALDMGNSVDTAQCRRDFEMYRQPNASPFLRSPLSESPIIPIMIVQFINLDHVREQLACRPLHNARKTDSAGGPRTRRETTADRRYRRSNCNSRALRNCSEILALFPSGGHVSINKLERVNYSRRPIRASGYIIVK